MGNKNEYSQITEITTNTIVHIVIPILLGVELVQCNTNEWNVFINKNTNDNYLLSKAYISKEFKYLLPVICN